LATLYPCEALYLHHQDGFQSIRDTRQNSRIGEISITISKRGAKEWTWLIISEITNYDAPCELSFHKGWLNLIESIVAELSLNCGDLVLWPSDGDPEIYSEGRKLSD
jgi:hypothetical protein